MNTPAFKQAVLVGSLSLIFGANAIAATAATPNAKQPPPPPLLIATAQADNTLTNLTLTGISFVGGTTRVFLGTGTTSLQITSLTSTSVTVLLPAGIQPGSYLLTVTTSAPNSSDEFWATIGAAGPTGAAGAQGPQGVQGPMGQAGLAGSTGPKGDTGSTGPQGPAGSAGSQGPAGPMGAAGAQGPAGPQGAMGAVGPQGSRAPTVNAASA